MSAIYEDIHARAKALFLEGALECNCSAPDIGVGIMHEPLCAAKGYPGPDDVAGVILAAVADLQAERDALRSVLVVVERERDRLHQELSTSEWVLTRQLHEAGGRITTQANRLRDALGRSADLTLEQAVDEAVAAILGAGEAVPVVCLDCHGRGELLRHQPGEAVTARLTVQRCERCSGRGAGGGAV